MPVDMLWYMVICNMEIDGLKKVNESEAQRLQFNVILKERSIR